MLFDRTDAPATGAGVRDLRAIALRLGASLGWEPAEVASFAAKLTERSWEELGPHDLLRVVDEYLTLGEAVAALRTRPSASRRGGHRAVRA